MINYEERSFVLNQPKVTMLTVEIRIVITLYFQFTITICPNISYEVYDESIGISIGTLLHV